MKKIELEILGLTASQASNGAYALILKETAGSRRLPIVIGAPEAQAIAVEMEGIKPPRPMTHDLLKNLIEQFNTTVTEVVITEIRDSTFYASIVVEGLTEDLDARPSDAIALAVRFNAPIYVSENILDEGGFLPEGQDEFSEEESSDEGQDILDKLRKSQEEQTQPERQLDFKSLPKLEQLKLKLVDAINAENYELAAQIRDEMKKLDLN